jgi:low temperature requirement protein LtrA
MVLLEETEQHGVFNGLIYATMVIFVDLWLFWIPAHLWITNRKENDRTKRIMARLLNFFAGLLLSTAWNPIYRLLALFMEAPY